MARAIIFANGSMEQPPPVLKNLQAGDVIIAADGGSLHCKTLGIMPQVIIGDFDSLTAEEITAYQDAGVETIQHPRAKDETDLELALQLAVKRGAREVYVLAALGARWDMTLANILLLAHPSLAGLKVRLLAGNQEFFVLRGGEQVGVTGKAGDPISLIPLAGDVAGITTQGLEYPLRDETLYFGTTRGVSNAFAQDGATIQVKKGMLLCILNWVEDRP